MASSPSLAVLKERPAPALCSKDNRHRRHALLERSALSSLDEENLPIGRHVRRDAKVPGLFKGEAARLAKRQALHVLPRRLLASQVRLGRTPKRTLGAGTDRLFAGELLEGRDLQPRSQEGSNLARRKHGA